MKKIVVVFSVAIAAISANASYLYWEINKSYSNIETATSWAGGNYTEAILWQVDSSGNKTKLQTEEPKAGKTERVHVALTGGSSYSYYIELVNSSGSVASSYATSYATLQSENVIYETELDVSQVPTATMWHGGTYRATPEPTSAMLMLIGVAGLALRRKQRKA